MIGIYIDGEINIFTNCASGALLNDLKKTNPSALLIKTITYQDFDISNLDNCVITNESVVKDGQIYLAINEEVFYQAE